MKKVGLRPAERKNPNNLLTASTPSTGVRVVYFDWNAVAATGCLRDWLGLHLQYR